MQVMKYGIFIEGDVVKRLRTKSDVCTVNNNESDVHATTHSEVTSFKTEREGKKKAETN